MRMKLPRLSRVAKSGGFTLVELMVALAIVAILSTVAYPSYIRHIAQANRAAVKAFMLNVANQQEQYLLNSRSYFLVGGSSGNTWATFSITVPREVSDNYTVEVSTDTAVTVPNYTITATPNATQLSRDGDCGTLTLNQLGVKDSTNHKSSCW